MQDMVPRGTGNSRWMKSAIDSTTTWEQFRDMLRAGTFPFDFNGVNSAGISQRGTALNKANLLPDAVAAMFGLGSDAVPSDVLEKLASAAFVSSGSLVDVHGTAVGIKMEIVSYRGTGTSGESYPTSVTASFPIKIAVMLGNVTNGGSVEICFGSNGDQSVVMVADLLNSNDYTEGNGFFTRSGGTPRSHGKISEDGKTISWYLTTNFSSSDVNSIAQFNNTSRTYYCLFIGF